MNFSIRKFNNNELFLINVINNDLFFKKTLFMTFLIEKLIVYDVSNRKVQR